jgi:4-hydroxy-tetrahydrodipicolinate reductase
MLKVGIAGGTGKLGKDILAQLLDHGEIAVGAVIARRGNPFVGKDAGALIGRLPVGVEISGELASTRDCCDVYIDCTNADAFRTNAEAYLAAGKPVIIATTGFDAEGHDSIGLLARNVPVVVCPNFSIGVYKFLKLVRLAAEMLDSDMDIDILEYHHKQKKDMPSGTAKKLADTIREVRGNTGSATEVSIHSIRAGNLIGEHSVSFINGENERIELSHKIFSRDSFAKGIVQTVKWIHEQDVGLYGIEDIF